MIERITSHDDYQREGEEHVPFSCCPCVPCCDVCVECTGQSKDGNWLAPPPCAPGPFPCSLAEPSMSANSLSDPACECELELRANILGGCWCPCGEYCDCELLVWGNVTARKVGV